MKDKTNNQHKIFSYTFAQYHCEIPPPPPPPDPGVTN